MPRSTTGYYLVVPPGPGVEKRFREFVAWLRSLPGYEEAIGEALHLVSTPSPPRPHRSCSRSFPCSSTG